MCVFFFLLLLVMFLRTFKWEGCEDEELNWNEEEGGLTVHTDIHTVFSPYYLWWNQLLYGLYGSIISTKLGHASYFCFFLKSVSANRWPG